jgi:PAS domain S-box-containing protein
VKVHTKLSLILVLVTAIFIAGIAALQMYNTRRATELTQLKINEKNTLFDKILKLENSSLETFVYDLSHSVTLAHIRQGNIDYEVRQHVLPYLDSFNVHGFWILRPDLVPLFEFSKKESLTTALHPLLSGRLVKDLSFRPFQSFFIHTPQGYLQTITAPIQQPDDEDRTARPQGYLFAGRLWDADYLEELSALTETTISIMPLEGTKEDRPQEAGRPWDIRFTRTMSGWDKSFIAEIVISSESEQIKDFLEATRMQMHLIFGFSATILLVLFVFIRKTLRRPLMLISESLTDDNPAPLAPLRNTATEFGKIAELINSFFNQKNELNCEIAAHKQAEDALQRFRFMVENAGQEIYLANPDGSLEYVNHAAAASLGYSVEEMITLGIAGFDPDKGQQFELYFEKAKKPEPPTFITVHIAKDRKRLFKELKITYLRIGDREYICGMGQDITERLRIQEEIKASRDLLEKIFKTSPDIIMMLNTAQDIIAVNDAVEPLTGYAPQEILGQSASIFLPEGAEDRAPLFAAMKALVENGFIRGTETLWRRKDGSHIYLECSSTLLRDEQQNISGSISILRDASDKRKMEEQLRQTQKMEAIGTLAGGIAHDFNNILGAIFGYTELAQETVAESSETMENLEQILKAADRAKELVQQILAFSRKTDSVRKAVQFHDILHEAVKLLRASIPTTIDIRQVITPGNDTLLADPTQLHQIIMNLCTNAAQAMQESGGVLELRLFPFTLDEEDTAGYTDLPPGPYVQLTVRDTGPGIPRENLTRIFDPFFTTKEVGKGTGMGLAVVHGIVKSHGGEIKVYSEPGSGTAFHIVLPCREQEPALETVADTIPIPRGTERILLIDDEEMLLNIGKSMLESLDYQVTPVPGSVEALSLFRNHPDEFDLIMTDQTMPAMTGDRLARECLQIRPDIPVILCSGYSEQISEKKALHMGIRAYLLKPFSRRILAETIRKVLDSTV